MAQRFNLVVLCAVALLAAVTQTDARRFPTRSSSVSVTLVGPGSYSSSQSTAFPSAGTSSPSNLLTQIFNNERAIIMQESRQSQASRPGDRFARSKLPTSGQFPAPAPRPRFSWPSSSRNTFSPSVHRSSGFGSTTTHTSGSSSVVTSGSSHVSVGGSGSASASSSSSFFSSFG